MEPQPIIDTHVHFWDLNHSSLRYEWLAPGAIHPTLGDIDAIKSQRFDIDALWAEARFARVKGFVHVEAAISSSDPVEETRWLAEMRSHTSVAPFVIVAHAALGEPGVEKILDRHSEFPHVVGIRDFGAEPYLASGEISVNYEASLTSLAKRQLIFDLDCEWQNFEQARRLAQRHPQLRIVLEHLGYPRRRDLEYFTGWKTALGKLAQEPNIYCKISGIGMTDPRGDSTSFGPWIDHCLQSFEPGRCVIGSNWPVDRLVSSYDAIMSIYRNSLADLSASEQAAVCSGNATELYKL